MDKPLLKLGFTDTFDAIANFFINHLSDDFNIIRDDLNPDYLIFGDRNFGNNNVNFNNRNCVKIFYTGENERPHNYSYNYAISFDHIDDANHYRLPLYVVYDYDNQHRNVTNSKTVNRDGRDLNKKFKDKFCSFVVKNGSCQKRNNFFHRLNEYKRVDSAGPLFNNVGYVLPRGDDSISSKMNFLNNYKFNLCFENSSYPGYTTEKLYEAYMFGTVPIYWGSTTIECDFNPKAFLNWHDYQDDDAFFEAIVKVDQSPELYEQMYMESLFHNWKEPYNKYMDMDRFRSWFKKNVYQKKNENSSIVFNYNTENNR
jgi:hypothetical protein